MKHALISRSNVLEALYAAVRKSNADRAHMGKYIVEALDEIEALPIEEYGVDD